MKEKLMPAPLTNRRGLLRIGAALAGTVSLGAVLSACGAGSSPAAPTAAPAAPQTAPTAAPTTAAAAPTTAPAAAPTSAAAVPTTSAAASPAATTPQAAATSGSIQVGILHSLSGTMAISEVAVKNAELMAIDEINAKGGVMGKKIEPIIEDGASDWPTFAEKAKLLLQDKKVAAIFGCWTSASRKAVLPVVEQFNGLLYYPVQYEGLEQSPNIFYICAPPNQQIIPAVTYLLQQKKTKFYLLGSDYVFPRTANKIIKAQLAAEKATTVGEDYTPLGDTDYSTILSKITAASPDVVFNTLNGDSNVAFFKQLADSGLTADKLATMSVSIAEVEVKGIGAKNMVGHLTAWNYFQSMDLPANQTFVKNFQKRYGADQVTDDPIEHAYTAVYLWAKSVEKAGSTDVAKVREAAKGLTFDAPQGPVKIDATNQHIWEKASIGKARPDGQFDIIWTSPDSIQPDPFLKTYSWGKGLANG